MMKKIWDKFMNREVVSYLIFGVLTTFVNWIIYGVMVETGADYRISTAAAWVVSVLFAFVVNKLFVFQSYSLKPVFVIRELVSFVSCRVLSFVMELVFMIVMVSRLHIGEYVSKLLVSVFVIIANYVFSKLFIFKKNKMTPAKRGK